MRRRNWRANSGCGSATAKPASRDDRPFPRHLLEGVDSNPVSSGAIRSRRGWSRASRCSSTTTRELVDADRRQRLRRRLAGLVGKTEAIGEAFHITSDEVLTWNKITPR